VYGLNGEIPEYDNPINENASDFFGMFYYEKNLHKVVTVEL